MRAIGTALGLGMVVFAASCAPNPKYVAASTARPGSIKFLYVAREGGQGVIKCNRGDDGTLSECRRIDIVLEGE